MSCSLLGHPDFFFCSSCCTAAGLIDHLLERLRLSPSPRLWSRAWGSEIWAENPKGPEVGPSGPTEKLRSGKREANGFNGHCWLCEFTFWWSVFACFCCAEYCWCYQVSGSSSLGAELFCCRVFPTTARQPHSTNSRIAQQVCPHILGALDSLARVRCFTGSNGQTLPAKVDGSRLADS